MEKSFKKSCSKKNTAKWVTNAGIMRIDDIFFPVGQFLSDFQGHPQLSHVFFSKTETGVSKGRRMEEDEGKLDFSRDFGAIFCFLA